MSAGPEFGPKTFYSPDTPGGPSTEDSLAYTLRMRAIERRLTQEIDPVKEMDSFRKNLRDVSLSLNPTAANNGPAARMINFQIQALEYAMALPEDDEILAKPDDAEKAHGQIIQEKSVIDNNDATFSAWEATCLSPSTLPKLTGDGAPRLDPNPWFWVEMSSLPNTEIPNYLEGVIKGDVTEEGIETETKSMSEFIDRALYGELKFFSEMSEIIEKKRKQLERDYSKIYGFRDNLTTEQFTEWLGFLDGGIKDYYKKHTWDNVITTIATVFNVTERAGVRNSLNNLLERLSQNGDGFKRDENVELDSLDYFLHELPDSVQRDPRYNEIKYRAHMIDISLSPDAQKLNRDVVAHLNLGADGKIPLEILEKMFDIKSHHKKEIDRITSQHHELEEILSQPDVQQDKQKKSEVEAEMKILLKQISKAKAAADEENTKWMSNPFFEKIYMRINNEELKEKYKDGMTIFDLMEVENPKILDRTIKNPGSSRTNIQQAKYVRWLFSALAGSEYAEDIAFKLLRYTGELGMQNASGNALDNWSGVIDGSWNIFYTDLARYQAMLKKGKDNGPVCTIGRMPTKMLPTFLDSIKLDVEGNGETETVRKLLLAGKPFYDLPWTQLPTKIYDQWLFNLNQACLVFNTYSNELEVKFNANTDHKTFSEITSAIGFTFGLEDIARNTEAERIINVMTDYNNGRISSRRVSDLFSADVPPATSTYIDNKGKEQKGVPNPYIWLLVGLITPHLPQTTTMNYNVFNEATNSKDASVIQALPEWLRFSSIGIPETERPSKYDDVWALSDKVVKDVVKPEQSIVFLFRELKRQKMLTDKELKAVAMILGFYDNKPKDVQEINRRSEEIIELLG